MLPRRSFPAAAFLGILLAACSSQGVSEPQPAAGVGAKRPELVVRDPRDLPRIDCGTVIKARVVNLTKRGWLTSAQDVELEILEVLWVGSHYDRPFERALGPDLGWFFELVQSGRLPARGARFRVPSAGRCLPWHEGWAESFWFSFLPLAPFSFRVESDYWVAIKSLPSTDLGHYIAAAVPAQ